MVKGYRYGKEYVPMPSDMDGLLKISAPAAAIALLGTLPRRRYPHATSFMSDARGLAATDGDARAAAALAAISKALSRSRASTRRIRQLLVVVKRRYSYH